MTLAKSQAPLRIALFTGNYNHILDGVSMTLNRLVEYLEREGHNVLVFGPTVSAPPIQHEGRFIAIPSVAAPGRREYRVTFGLTQAGQVRLKAFSPHLIHIATPDLLGRAALQWGRRWGVPVVASYHTHFTSYLKYYNMEWAEGWVWKYARWFYRQCEHIYVPSASMAEVLKAQGILGEIRLWERGVDTDKYNPGQRDPAWRHTLGFADEDVVISFVSRVVWEKGLRTFADVIKALKAKGIPHQSMVVGEGPAREELERLLPDTRFTGYLKGEALARAYASSDVFLFPSETETFGNVTLEAMASSVPTVCADATGSRSLVEHGVTGYLAPPRDTDTFLRYTAQLVQDPALRSNMAQAALGKAVHYDWDAVMARIAGYYQEVHAQQQRKHDVAVDVVKNQ